MRTVLTGSFAYMVDHIVDATAPRGRVEIRSGVGRRRRWSDEDKGDTVIPSRDPVIGQLVAMLRHIAGTLSSNCLSRPGGNRSSEFANPLSAPIRSTCSTNLELLSQSPMQ